MYGLPGQDQMMCALASAKKETDRCSGLDKRPLQDFITESFNGNVGVL